MQKIIIKKIEPVFEDERGAIFDLLEEDVRHAGLITFVKGARRGNHYHKKSTQYTYILSGAIELIIKDAEILESPIRSYRLSKGDLATIPPLIIHTYHALEPSSILDFTTESRRGKGYEEDTIRVDPL